MKCLWNLTEADCREGKIEWVTISCPYVSYVPDDVKLPTQNDAVFRTCLLCLLSHIAEKLRWSESL